MFFILNVAKDILSTSINGTHAESFSCPTVEYHEGVCLLYL